MSEPDELYTLRAQFWLGHYQLAIEEAKSVARRPMSPALKVEREVFLARALLAMGQADRLGSADAPALEALSLKIKFEESSGNEAVQEQIIDQIKTLLGSNPGDSLLQLVSSQILLTAGLTKEALQCVYASATMETACMALQIYLKLDRLDLARQQLQTMKQKDEDSVLTQLASVYVHLATGSTSAADAVHVLNSLSEQYGYSVFLLNLTACALMQQGDYSGAEQKLEECLRDHTDAPAIADTLVNLVACCVQQNKSPAEYVTQIQQQFGKHPFCAGFERVNGAFDREAVKYKV